MQLLVTSPRAEAQLASIFANSLTALAANGTLRFALGAVFPLFTLQMYDQLGVHWAGTVFACLSVVLLPIPWLLMRYGHRLRARSRVLP